MLTQEFSYSLPEQAISRQPAEPRDSAKLLVSRTDKELIDARVYELSDFLSPGDVLVVNNTKVLPARIMINRSSGASGEIFLLHRIDEGVWNALVKPSAKINEGEIVFVRSDVSGIKEKFTIEVGENLGEGHRVVKFIDVGEQDLLKIAGRTPLPPYLGDIEIPIERYQTMFAKDEQSVAAPTAGLHFTPDLTQRLNNRGVIIFEVTLHVGVGTFRPIKTKNIEDHIMHEENYWVGEDVWRQIQSAKKAGANIIAVGTTSLRTLESVALKSELSGATDLYCYGDFNFQVVDFLFTNFHQPESSLLVLLDSYIGSRWRELYDHALGNNYRFLSFGDAMLVGRK